MSREVPLAWGLERQRPMARCRGERRHACECERSRPHRGADHPRVVLADREVLRPLAIAK